MKRVTTVLAIAGAAALLAGCAAGPTRGDDGRVTEASVIAARDLVTGDCFSFNSPDGKTVAEATVVPCGDGHDYVIIGQGQLSASAITEAGSLQAAVSQACSESFDLFTSANTSDERPHQEFIVYPVDDDEPDGDRHYSCVSTDPAQSGLVAG